MDEASRLHLANLPQAGGIARGAEIGQEGQKEVKKILKHVAFDIRGTH